MKNTIITFILSAVALLTVSAQDADKKISIRNISIETDIEMVNISFTAKIARKAAPSGTTLVYAPVITDGQYKVSLPAIVVQGNRAKQNWVRHEWASDVEAAYENGIYTRNGSTVNYNASVPFQPWMLNQRIDIETVTSLCCNSYAGLFTMVSSILTTTPAERPEPIVSNPAQTIVEQITKTYPFVLPAEMFNSLEPIRFDSDERDKALTVYYKINKHNIEESYANNRQTLTDLIAAIKLIRQNNNVDVERVVIAGFASPEGPYELNDYLAWERAVSVREYIVKNTDMPGSDINLFNGSADWHGLRLLISQDSNVPAQAEALRIIDNNPTWNSRTNTDRMSMLRSLRGGETYRYITKHIFPKLRNGAFIRVYINQNQIN